MTDLDIVPATSPTNRDRPVAALNELGTRERRGETIEVACASLAARRTSRASLPSRLSIRPIRKKLHAGVTRPTGLANRLDSEGRVDGR